MPAKRCQQQSLEPGNPATVAVGLQSYIGLYMGMRVEISFRFIIEVLPGCFTRESGDIVRIIIGYNLYNGIHHHQHGF